MASVLRHAVVCARRSRFFSYSYGSLPAKRTLYSSAAIGLDMYESVRERISQQFSNMEDKFRRRMEQCLSSESDNIIFTEDLKNMVHLVENKPEDVELCIQMMRKFATQNKDLRFGTYKFGPVVMRMFHHLGRHDQALKLALDPELEGFFDQISSYQILMDMLFKVGKYEDVLKTYELVQQKQLYGSKYPKDCTLLAIATCYKMNTPESLKYVVSILKGAEDNGASVVRKASMLAAALAIKQNSPQIAMEILSLSPNVNYVTVRNLRIAALADLDRVEEAISSLKFLLDRDVPDPNRRKQEIFTETLAKVNDAVNRAQNKELTLEFKNIERALRENQHLAEEKVETLLLSPILPRDQTINNNQFSRNPKFGGYNNNYNRRDFGGNQGFNDRNEAFSDRQHPRARTNFRQRKGLNELDD